MQNLMDFGGGVSFVWIIIIGGLAGWIAEKITKSDMGLIKNIIVGIIGSFIGERLTHLFDLRVGEMMPGWFWSNLIVSVIGAVILIWVVRAVRGQRT